MVRKFEIICRNGVGSGRTERDFIGFDSGRAVNPDESRPGNFGPCRPLVGIQGHAVFSIYNRDCLYFWI